MGGGAADDDARPAEGFRPCVGLMLIGPDGRVLVARRSDLPGDEAWQMPQGGIDPGEPAREAALRELREEIGTEKAEIIGESRGWLHYELPARLRGKALGGRWRGQSQKWFALRFTGRDSDIRLTGHEPEFVEWKWVELDALPGLIVDFKRAVYEAVVEEFRPLVEREGARRR